MKASLLLLMFSVVMTAVGLAGSPSPETGQAPAGKALRPVHTFSIVARDPETGNLGVAVQSHWFSVGQLVTWAKAGVGVVATQSFVEPAYGPRGLALMESGLTATDALKALLDVDPGREVRQVAFVDARGNVGAYTGKRCIRWAGHHTGDGYSVQANMMLTDRVVPAMAEAYEKSRGDLTDRLLAALDAAQAAGGDIRGKQSAAILIVRGTSTGRPWADRLLDLRVDDNPEPLKELHRLVTIHRAYTAMNQGDAAVERNDLAAAEKHYSAAARLLPDNLEIIYWQGITLATNGEMTQAMPLLKKVFAADSNWVELTRRLPAAGIIPDTPEGHKLLDRILQETGQEK